jgi:hypothetical protein
MAPFRPLTPRDRDNMTPAATLLLLLICTDLAFILLHLVSVETRWLRGAGISLEADRGLPETYQYVKEFWIAACMAATFWRTRERAYIVWSAMFLFLLLDDAGQIHEHVGAWVGQRYALPSAFGLRADDTGELLFAAAIGGSMLALVGLTSWRGGERSGRISRDVLGLIAALAVLGVVVDMLHVIAYLQRSLLAQVLLVIEDGGEMLVMSALTAYAFHLASHGGRTQFDLWAEVKARVGGTAASEGARGLPATRRHAWAEVQHSTHVS